MHKSAIIFLAASAAISAPALANIPPAVDAMLDAAIAGGDEKEVDAIAKFAKSTNPDAAKDIDAKVTAFKAKLAAAAEAKAAADLEEKRSAGLLENWSGTGELGAFRSSGNSSNTGVTAGLNLTRAGVKWTHNFRALADFQRSNGVTTREQFVAAIEPHYNINDRLFAYGLGQYERDKFQGYSARYSASAGLGYKVIDNDSMTLNVKGGPAWRQTQFVAGGSQSSLAGLVNADFAWRISPTITFRENATAYLESANTTLKSLTALDAKLSERLTGRLSYQIERNSNPPAGLANTDTLSRVTIIYGF